MVFSQGATRLRAEGGWQVVTSESGREIRTKTVLLATGVFWRRLGIPELEALIGAGVYYGAASIEAKAMAGKDVFVVGGGNSAGQAVANLAQHAKSVTLLVRAGDLRKGMSDYLVRDIEGLANVAVRLDTEIVRGVVGERLEGLVVRDRLSGLESTLEGESLFVMIGAEPKTDWLKGSVARSDEGYILTGRDVPLSSWRLARAPLLLETSVPGVFAAGDVRYRSVKRVASAVGEGATAVQLVHEYLSERDAPVPEMV
jgi:thioredoxin reductase (NADPH)